MPFYTPLKESLLTMNSIEMGSDDQHPTREFINGRQCAVDDELLQQRRQRRLTDTLHYAAETSEHYRKAFDGIDLDLITVEDLSPLPFTTSQQLSEGLSSFTCISQTKIPRIVSFASSGTTGPNKHVCFSAKDIDRIAQFMAAGISTVATKNSVVQIMIPNGLSCDQADLLRRGVELMGGTPVVTGTAISLEEQLDSIMKNRPDVLFAEGHLMFRLTKAMEHTHDLSSLGVQTVFLSTSTLSESMERQITRAWGCTLSHHYGMTEMGLGLAVDCPVCKGMHYNEFGVIAEVVNPQTGEKVPEGDLGEIVVTSLGREAMPLIRYRTGDWGRITPSDRDCPSYPLEVLEFAGYRIKSEVTLNCGAVINPTTFHQVIFEHPEVIDYEISLVDAQGFPGQQDAFEFYVEARDAGPALQERLAESIRRQYWQLENNHPGCFNPEIDIKFMDAETLRQGRHFKKIIYDNRVKAQYC